MRVSKSQLCGSCLKIRPIMSNGKPFEYSIAEIIDGEGYRSPFGVVNLNHMMLDYLKENGGCNRCISVMERIVDAYI